MSRQDTIAEVIAATLASATYFDGDPEAIHGCADYLAEAVDTRLNMEDIT